MVLPSFYPRFRAPLPGKSSFHNTAQGEQEFPGWWLFLSRPGRDPGRKPQKAAGRSCGEDKTGILVAVQMTFLEQAVCGALVVDYCSEPLNINVAETQLEE